MNHYPPSTAQALPVPYAWRQPPDPVEGLALVAEVVRTGDDSRGRAEAVRTMHQRVALLLSDADPAARLRELAAHAALLSDLSARYSIKALEAASPKHAAIWQRLALQCQAAYTRSLIAMEGLKAQAEGKAQVNLDDDSASDEPSDSVKRPRGRPNLHGAHAADTYAARAYLRDLLLALDVLGVTDPFPSRCRPRGLHGQQWKRTRPTQPDTTTRFILQPC